MADLDPFTFDVIKGDTFSYELTCTDANNAPVDLTGYAARMAIKNRRNLNTIKEISTIAGGITNGGNTGVLDLSISASNTALFDAVDAVYDIEITHPAGDNYTIMEGKFIINTGVTN